MTHAARALVPLLLCASIAHADTYPRQPGIDIEHYTFRLTLGDDTDEIAGETTVLVAFLRDDVRAIKLDLVSAAGRTDGRGMTVSDVSTGETPLRYTHEHDRLAIVLDASPRARERRPITIRYRGVPATGLVIGRNRHGDRGFFSDNWPDKARHWLPALDHPSDKATSEFIVTAPAHYQVVANGVIVEETDLPGGRRRTHWRQSKPIATWLNVLGAARFAVQHAGTVDGVPIQTWVFPQDRDAGFHDFAGPTRSAFEFFSARIGPYPYEKLANVQSNSVSGGMESATAIFYDDDAVTGTRSVRWRNVIVHEIAHQWWGNAVTETDWDHVWLSEGFATYFTLLFIEHAYGRDAFVAGLRESRDFVRRFDAAEPDYRIVHDGLADTSRVLTRQIYEKGGWTLHMLRGLVGDEAFWEGIRRYYGAYRDANASTDDFRSVMEEASGRDLGWFFAQWLYRGGYPRLEGEWRYDAGAGVLEIELRQTQPRGEPFRLPIDVAITVAGEAAPRRERIELTGRLQRFRIPLEREAAGMVLDPDTWVLMDATLADRRSR